MLIEPKYCPCGCGNVILHPISCKLTPEQAHEIAVKLNRHDDLMACLDSILLNPTSVALRQIALNVFFKVKDELKEEPKIGKFHETDNKGLDKV